MTPPKPSCIRPEAQSPLPLTRAARDREIGVSRLGLRRAAQRTPRRRSAHIAAQVRHKCGTSAAQVRSKCGASAEQVRNKCGGQCGYRPAAPWCQLGGQPSRGSGRRLGRRGRQSSSHARVVIKKLIYRSPCSGSVQAEQHVARGRSGAQEIRRLGYQENKTGVRHCIKSTIVMY